ncbi:MAG: hypothetical protein OXB94_11800 [Nitrospira sp.]|nr:hypothetical protein [Nitrospira sp.]
MFYTKLLCVIGFLFVCLFSSLAQANVVQVCVLHDFALHAQIAQSKALGQRLKVILPSYYDDMERHRIMGLQGFTKKDIDVKELEALMKQKEELVKAIHLQWHTAYQYFHALRKESQANGCDLPQYADRPFPVHWPYSTDADSDRWAKDIERNPYSGAEFLSSQQ